MEKSFGKLSDLKEFDNLQTEEGRAKFIRAMESGIYTGKDSDGLDVRVLLDQGKGMTIYSVVTGNPYWWEVAYYDQDGYCEGTTCERRNK